MKGIILLNYSDNVEKVEEEEKLKFLFDLLKQIGVPIESISSAFSISDKIELRKLLTTFKISVKNSKNGMLVFFENQLIGKWNKCSYVVKNDIAQEDNNKKLYIELQFDYWSINEEENK